MRVIDTIEELRVWRNSLQGTVGLVPTMGCLHEGHLALVRRARAENGHVGVSIFVNPTQFGKGEDYRRYPRDLPRDLNLLRDAGVDAILTPHVEEMFPDGFATYVEVGGLGEVLEGAARPGHFRGVATVIAKLFHIFQPNRAYFGQKDAQQVLVIQKLVSDLAFPLDIVAVPTVRAPDGLALSSRNVYLSPEERKAATALFAALSAVQARFNAGDTNVERLRRVILARLAEEPMITVEYVSLADSATLEELTVVDRSTLVSLAAQVGSHRLIDNIVLDPANSGRS